MATTSKAEAIIEDEALVEEQLLDELENEEIPTEIREARFAELKRQAQDYHGLREKEHGKYTELLEEKLFLEMTTQTEKCVIHFYHTDFRRCSILDTHLKAIAEKYFETKFAKINVDTAKFFIEKLKIRILPALICFKNGMVVDRIIGFDDMGNTDTFPTSLLERRLGQSGVIEVADLEVDTKKKIFGFEGKNNKADSDSDDDNDW